MLPIFSVGLRTLLFLAILTLCLLAGLISSLDENSRLSSRIQHVVPQIPFRKQDSLPLETSPVPAEQVTPLVEDVLPEWDGIPDEPEPESLEHHWIDDLISNGTREYDELLAKQTHGAADAAIAYKRRRGRQPPPRFGEWVRFAEEQGAIVVEDFFDQIYHDLDPFWAIKPESMRHAARAWKCFISIRDGNTTYHTDEERPWMHLWTDMIAQISHHLPDMDIAINEMDESRIMVPFESIEQYLEIGELNWSKFPSDPSQQITDYPLRYNKTFDKELFPDHGFHTLGSLWSLAQEACPPESPGRHAQWDVDFRGPAVFPSGAPEGTYHGYVSNWTNSKDPCIHSHLRELHGSFVEPVTMSSTTKLIPMFGGSKLPMNNDILLPAAMYWTNDPFYKGSEKRIPWSQKKDSLIWRGDANGGRNRNWQWHRFQRHRFLSMLNGTQVHAEELMGAARKHPELGIDVDGMEDKTAHNFPLPPLDVYNLSSALDGRLGPWTESYSDGKFVRLLCFPDEHRGPNCSYTDPFFETSTHTPMEAQYEYKYLPDIDGNSFSGRYRGFLRSYSLPIKATIYSEWHDSRLVPWKHFAPMDNTFVDFYGIMEYFLGYEPVDVAADDGSIDSNLRNAYSLDASLHTSFDASTSPKPQAAPGNPADWKRQADDAAHVAPPAFHPPPRKEAHDTAARRIAEAGHEWAEKVLRREDMLVYTYRLLLEYARLTSDHRERMGWVGEGEPIEGHSPGNFGGQNDEVRAELAESVETEKSP